MFPIGTDESSSGQLGQPVNSSSGQGLDVLNVPSCENDCFHGLQIFSRGGWVCVELCSCTESLPENTMSELRRRVTGIQNSGIPPTFANSLYAGRSFDDVAPDKLKQWLYDICHSQSQNGEHIFLCGNVGTGKTHLVSDCLKRFIMVTGDLAYYTTASFIIDAKKNAAISSYLHFDTGEKNRRKLETLSFALTHARLFIIDEIRGSLSQKDVAYLEEFIDKRYQSGLATAFVSNHTMNAKTSYNGKTISNVIGDRNGDRLRKAVICELTGKSKRGLRPSNYTEAELMNYCFPDSVLSLGKDDRQILNWITRNPVFEPINRTEREIAINTEGQPVYRDGVPVDADRKHALVKDDVWQKGDKLVLTGPILCKQDAKTYVTCLHLLKEQHCRRHLGLRIKVTPSYLMRALGISPTSLTNRESLHRSLSRISSATINYGDNRGRQWVGPLFYFSYKPTDPDGSYQIYFNESMIPFYRSHEYCVLNKEVFDAQIGADGIRMQLFLRSHLGNRFNTLNFMGWMKFLGKPVERMNKKTPANKIFTRRHRKKFSELIREQIKAGLLTGDSGITSDGEVVLNVVPHNAKTVRSSNSLPH